MQSTVKKLEVVYNPINERNIFTNGDIITGQVTLETEKDCQIESLFVKFKGKAKVLWSETYGQATVVYHAKEKYFTVKQYFIQSKDVKDGEHVQLINQSTEYSSVVAPGVHAYPFSFQFPYMDIPSSFKSSHGKILYSLEARLSRSMKADKKEATFLNFVAKADPNIPWLMTPQNNSLDKKMKLFTSGSVAMDVNLEKSGFHQGEEIRVVSFIRNDSSREIKPKYCIYKKHSYKAQGRRTVHTKDLIKEEGPSISEKTSETVTQVITIPHDADPSILNCNILKSEYRLKVYLDVKYASDPEVKFDIVILPKRMENSDVPPSAPGFSYGPVTNPAALIWTYEPSAIQPSAPLSNDANGMNTNLDDFYHKYY